MPDIFPAKQLSQIIITYWNTERIMAYLTTQQSLIVTLQELYIAQRLWRGPDWSCHSASFPSNTKENALNGDRIWLVGFVPVDENISLSVLINTALCPCPVLLCLITSSALLSSQLNFKVFSKYLLESFLEHRWITGGQCLQFPWEAIKVKVNQWEFSLWRGFVLCLKVTNWNEMIQTKHVITLLLLQSD